MFDIHTTADGEQLMICHMSDTHLVNTIRLLCSRLQAAREFLSDSSVNSIHTALKVKPLGWDNADATEAIQIIHEKIPSYVIEANLRGLSEQLKLNLQAAYGRNTAVSSPSSFLCLSNSIKDSFNPCDEE